MGSSPNWTYGYVPTVAQWSAAFATKQDDLGYTPVNRAGDTMAGRLVTFGATTERAGFNLSIGVDPNSPNEGDMWFTALGLFYFSNGATIGPVGPGTVTEIGLTAPSELTVAGSPVSGSGTFALTWADQGVNTFFAGPSSGPDDTPTFRPLVADDLPAGAAEDNLGFLPLDPANNLSDVANPAAAAANLGAVAVGSVNRFTATQQWAKGADIASAASLTLGTDGNFFHVTGTTGITSISTQPAGTLVQLEFTGILTITHNGTSLILPNGANVTTYAGYCATFVSEGSGNWRLVSAIPPPPATPTRQVFTASGTYTRPARLVRAVVTCIGGGGGGGFARPSSGQASAGSGGGAGGYSVSTLSAGTIGASQTVTIGAGGAGGIGSTPVVAGNGGDSSFGTLVVAKGGAGGLVVASTATNGSANGGPGGQASSGTGDVKSDGCPGAPSAVIAGTVGTALPGNGGASQLGGSGQGIVEATGLPGTLGGGGGGVTGSNGATRNGGAGGSGIVIVDEYY